MVNPITPQHQKLGLKQYIKDLNDSFGLEIPLLGFESPPAPEHNTPLPYQVYKHLRPLFYNVKVNNEVLKGDFADWINSRKVDVQAPVRSQRYQSEESPLLPSTSNEKDERMRYFLRLMKDKEWFLQNGVQEIEKKRLAEDPSLQVMGLSRKKRRLANNDEDEQFHTAPNSPVKGSLTASSPLGQHGNGNWQVPPMAQASPRPPRRASGTVNPLGIPLKPTQSAGKNQQTSRAPVKYSGTFPLPSKQMVQNPKRCHVATKASIQPQSDAYSSVQGSMGISAPAKTKEAIQSPRSNLKTTSSTASPKIQTKIFEWYEKKSSDATAPRHDDTVKAKKSGSYDKLLAASSQSKCDSMTPSVNTDFATRVASSIYTSHDSSMVGTFDTEITEPTDTQSTYTDSVLDSMTSEEMRESFDACMSMMENHDPVETNESVAQEIVNELNSYGPFALKGSFSAKIPLRFRYELERIGRAWGVPSDRMLVGDHVPYDTQDKFWAWISGHNQRNNQPLPEKTPSRAWDAAVDNFKSKKQSEVVVLSGEMDWCDESEPGIFKLNLNPLKLERTCRFHRRFGSDRFMTITVPAPDRPCSHQMNGPYPSALRECMATWLTRHEHFCLGRTWRAFYVEEMKTKRKSKGEPRFRIELFAVAGEDFAPFSKLSPAISPPRLQSQKPTRMTVESLLEWHMPKAANENQSNCKLFQRISLGLSKTFDTVTLKPTQIFHVSDILGHRDISGPTVMNDGCALMSRALANQICDRLGITTATPSCFQGRIAGAKGLWMVDRHQSSIDSMNDDDIWIQISDSQLKIHPHPENWVDLVDDEKLTFEVVNWAKPLHPVDLNIQLLAILEHGAQAKEYIAQLIRDGVQQLYDDFLQVLKCNSPVACRALLQKLRPSGENGAGKARRLEQWTANEAESIIRFSEAGFAPRDFYPLRVKIRKFLTHLLNRQVDELKIQVPLSTYAYCIADPYGVLEEKEVHFSFSNNWRDPNGQFEDNMLDGVDILVGRLPAHVPSDIQRCRAVWKSELHHFKDVIVFPTKGNTPLAHMLSGGDYDGDTPWICWDPKIVQNFRNSPLPSNEYTHDHYGLTTHSVVMSQLETTEDFLHSAFVFNLTVSNLGRCTVEHEKLAYEEEGSINSPKAKELACLLSHLVDGRKAGVHLSEPAWQAFRKKISPKRRELPAYRPGSNRPPNITNIIDYLKFEVAKSELRRILSGLNDAFPEHDISQQLDKDLLSPWKAANKAVEESSKHKAELQAALKEIGCSMGKWYDQWNKANKASSGEGFSRLARQAVESASAIPPPEEGRHPLIHTWRNSHHEWLRLLASYAYQQYSRTGFVLHAFGEILCQIKASCSPFRPVTNEIIACYRVNQKMVSHLTVDELPGSETDVDLDDFEDEDAIEAMLSLGRDEEELEDGWSIQ
ncbi:RNA-dependent RNA polymerase eukaryotic-type [Penicillium soppii]|uniref:RNA-dependent RNA polymerase eukaryotic-type n=1 Tax=Penicillium soppii TaxID=69789 RepID=UPI002547AF4B|nr:RNA-dependent RNA polymerase eukaryotic-type [Penicillium soppii]KAJ5851681.1 RNA-dependent RNA polymerase eukaryotic-type [Penicillium soppii]